jgi:hypothetical protein
MISIGIYAPIHRVQRILHHLVLSIQVKKVHRAVRREMMNRQEMVVNIQKMKQEKATENFEDSPLALSLDRPSEYHNMGLAETTHLLCGSAALYCFK